MKQVRAELEGGYLSRASPSLASPSPAPLSPYSRRIAAQRKAETARDGSSSPDFDDDEYFVDECQIAMLVSQFPDLDMEQAKAAVRSSHGDVKQSALLISTGAISLIEPPATGEDNYAMNRNVLYSKKDQRWRWSTVAPM